MKVERLAEIRRSRGLTQRALGERLGMSQPRVATIEAGLSIRKATADRLAAALLVDVSELMKPKEPTVTFKVSELSPEILALLSKK